MAKTLPGGALIGYNARPWPHAARTFRFKMYHLLALIITLIAATPLPEAQAGSRPAAADVEPTIDYLIGFVARSELSFVRNERRYSADEAARHMQRKYRHLRDEIHTVDDFIELAASRSLSTGEPYLVIDSTGRSTPTGQWLRQVLADNCGAAASTATATTSSDSEHLQCPR